MVFDTCALRPRGRRTSATFGRNSSAFASIFIQWTPNYSESPDKRGAMAFSCASEFFIFLKLFLRFFGLKKLINFEFEDFEFWVIVFWGKFFGVCMGF